MGKNILLIEKETSLREFWEEVLQDKGFSVISMGPEGGSLSDAGDITADMVFLGTGLDGASARKALEEMRKENEKLQVISPANPDELSQELKAIKMQGIDYRKHPIKVNQVKGAIREAIKIEGLKPNFNRISLRKRGDTTE